MCRFITLIVPEDCREGAMAVLKHHRGWVSQTNNKDLASIAPANSIQFISPSSGCDCGTILDNQWIQKRSDFDHEKLAHKWRLKGWSEFKIERGLADKEHGKATTTHHGPTDSFELWQTVLGELLKNCGSDGEVGLLLHHYSGSIDKEPMKPVRRRVSANFSLFDALHSVKEDELILFDRAWLRAQAA
jgi:hypothetical protein